MTSRRRLLVFAPLSCLILWPTPGCHSPTELELQRQVDRLGEQAAERDNQLASQRITIEQLHKQLQVPRGWSDDDLKVLFSPEKIVLGTLSGGADYDDKPGHDGITVYIKPIDRDGDAVKVAGDIRVQLLDLAAPKGERDVGEYFIPHDQVSLLWYGKFATYHYTVRCPWLSGPPANDEITIRVTFVDFLTQRTMTAQTVCKVQIPRS